MNNFVGATSVTGNATRAGRVRVLARDPPGQRSVYIPPGKILALKILKKCNMLFYSDGMIMTFPIIAITIIVLVL